nr:DNA-formamidopyrimidine glycosylase family protein [Sulfobacillus harzensis]
MPELPEMENYRRQLSRFLVGKTAQSIIAEWPKRLNCPAEVASPAIAGSPIESIERRGKSLAIGFERAPDTFRVLYIHLMLGGRISISREAQPAPVTLTLQDGLRVNFHVGLGRLDFLSPGALRQRWAHLGVEPLSPTYNGDRLQSAYSHSSRPIKTCLMDQKVVAGIGNVYSDEICYDVGLYPGQPASSLTDFQWQRLGAVLPTVLEKAVDAGGVGPPIYEGDQVTGGFRAQLAVHYQEGKACGNGGIVVKGPIGGRTAYWCSDCQPT